MAANCTACKCPTDVLICSPAGRVQQGQAAPRHASDGSASKTVAGDRPDVRMRSQGLEALPAQQQDDAHEARAAGSNSPQTAPAEPHWFATDVGIPSRSGEQHAAAQPDGWPDMWPDRPSHRGARRGEPPTVSAEHCQPLTTMVNSSMEWLGRQEQQPVNDSNPFPRITCVL